MDTPPDLRDATRAALKGWRKRHLDHSPFHRLRLYQQRLRAGPTISPYQATIDVLKAGVAALAGTNPAAADFLRERFDVGLSMAELAHAHSRGESTLYHTQHAMIVELAQAIAALEADITDAPQQLLKRRLPAPAYTQLVGVAHHLEVLERLLHEPAAPWSIALVGIGGLGKTSLADQLARHLVLQGFYDDVLWMSAQQVVFTLSGEIRPTGLPALTVEMLVAMLGEQVLGPVMDRPPLPVHETFHRIVEHLSRKRYLIVVDNLETAPDIERLLPWLQQLQSPAKVILTSRVQLRGHATIYPYELPELPRTAAFALIRQEARLQNFTALRDSPESVLESIYAIGGGNPLALRLIVGQAYLFGVDTVLNDIAGAHRKGEPLYAFIYKYIWTHLTPEAKTVLMSMVLLPESGGTLTMIFRASGISEPAGFAAVEQLIVQNLLNVQGDSGTRLYTIHNLTRAFLKDDVIKW